MDFIKQLKKLILPFEDPEHPMDSTTAEEHPTHWTEIDQQIEQANERTRNSGAKTATGKQTWEELNDPKSEQDLGMMRECMVSELAKARKKKRYFPAPYSAWRVAILLRKQKDYAGEVEAIKAYCEVAATKNYEHNTRYTKLRERLPKAQALLAKQINSSSEP